MTEHKHTPGPWVAEGLGIDSAAHNIAEVLSGADEDGNVRDREELEANALLIGAAPDMLEALEGLLGCTNLWEESDPRGTKHFLPPLRDKAKSAIAKATEEMK